MPEYIGNILPRLFKWRYQLILLTAEVYYYQTFSEEMYPTENYDIMNNVIYSSSTEPCMTYFCSLTVSLAVMNVMHSYFASLVYKLENIYFSFLYGL